MDEIASSWVNKQWDNRINLFCNVEDSTHPKKHCKVLLPIKDSSCLCNCLGIKDLTSL